MFYKVSKAAGKIFCWEFVFPVTSRQLLQEATVLLKNVPPKSLFCWLFYHRLKIITHPITESDSLMQSGVSNHPNFFRTLLFALFKSVHYSSQKSVF